MEMPIHATAFADATPIQPVLRRNRADHVFDLHPALHIGMFASFFGYLGLMWAAFGEKQLAIPFAIFAIFLAAAFIVPGMWAGVTPDTGGRRPDWADFMNEGLVSHTGRQDAHGVLVQVLIMPAVLLVWGLFLLIVSRLI